MLEVTLYDENKYSRFDFLGKVRQTLYLLNSEVVNLDLDPPHKSEEWRKEVV